MLTSPILLWALCSTLHLANAAQSNTTLDDSDSSISYQPSNRWRFVAVGPDTDLTSAYNQTFHEVVPGALTINSRTIQRRGGSLAVRAVDPPVSAQLSFTGTAVYVYCIIPSGPSTTNPTDTNLTFTLDGHDVPAGFTQDSAPASSAQSHALAFSQENLSNTAHTLRMNVQPDSAFLLDYIVYTKSDTPTPTGVSSSPSPTTTESAWTTWHNMATFVGAIGGSFGGLLVIVIGIVISILYRKRRARIRDAANQQNFEDKKSADPNTPDGLAKFTPRYFPGTVPPAYSPQAAASNSDLSCSSSRRSSFNVIHYGAPEPNYIRHSGDVQPYADGASSMRPSASVDITMPLMVFNKSDGRSSTSRG